MIKKFKQTTKFVSFSLCFSLSFQSSHSLLSPFLSHLILWQNIKYIQQSNINIELFQLILLFCNVQLLTIHVFLYYLYINILYIIYTFIKYTKNYLSIRLQIIKQQFKIKNPMNQKSEISYTAFLVELESWEVDLKRELNRLGYIKNEIKMNKSRNKKVINKIEILETQIQSQLLNYKKEKQKKIINFEYVINKYNNYSQKFLTLIDKINQIHHIQLSNTQSSTNFKQSFIRSINNNTQKSTQTLIRNSVKGYLEDTFTTKMAKKSGVRCKSITKLEKNPFNEPINSGWLQKLIKQVNQKKIQYKTIKNYRSNKNVQEKKTINKSIKNKNIKFRTQNIPQQQDIQSIKHQLNDIKSNILFTDNQITFHQHKQYDNQLNKLKQNNKKILLDLKIIKEEQTNFIHQIYQIKKQVNEEKKLQSKMIKTFQQSHRIQISKSTETPKEISEWVRIRLQK